MSFLNKNGGVSSWTEEPGKMDKLDKLDEALRDFRLSVHAFSEAAYSRPRRVVEPGRSRVWRLATGWALACVLIAGGASAGVWEHHRQEMKIAAAQLVEKQRLAAQEQARLARLDEENLLAKVDSDVSREVPSAMEPLAQMMAEDETR
jgi:Tfp pilus assembly protein PilN